MSKAVELRNKIRSISRINKMTKAMQVVAVTELKKIQQRQRSAANYKKHFESIAKKLNLNVGPQAKKIQPNLLIYLFVSERGFCGGFNESLVSKLKLVLAEQKAKKIELVVIGGKGREAVKESGAATVFKEIENKGKLSFSDISGCVLEAYNSFISGKAEKILILFNSFKSILIQTPVLQQALPFNLQEPGIVSSPILIEPSFGEIKEQLILHYLKAVFYDAFYQTRLGEVASRLLTMRNANENSSDMLDDLNLKLNKARQAMITFELSELVSSYEILGEEG